MVKHLGMALLAFAAGLAMANDSPGPLVDSAWVKANSCNDQVQVLDIRNRLGNGSREDFLQAHIPCAVYSDYLNDGWRKESNGVAGMLPPVAELERLIGGLGIDNQTHVVIVPGGVSALDMGSATRVYWTFKVLGHDQVSILDGGMAAYKADKSNPLAQGAGTPVQPQTFNANLRQHMLVDKAAIEQALTDPSISLIDHRPADMYMGINRHGKAKRAGTLPGAKNLPERWLTHNGGGQFREPALLSTLYGAADVDPNAPQINFCNTGHWASLGWFASHELLGNKNAKLYDGSMVEWSADESLPIEVKVPLD